MGGTGSGSLNINDGGPTKMIFKGCIIFAIELFQVSPVFKPGYHSLFIGNMPGSSLKNELLMTEKLAFQK